MHNISPTKSTELLLKDELQVIKQGYEFLDEKRVLLAQRIMQELERLKSFQAACEVQMERAASALRRAVARHGLDDLQVYPVAELHPSVPQFTEQKFLGIAMPEAELMPEKTAPQFAPADPSSEAEACRDAFRDLIYLAVKLACVSGNLSRIAAEYKQTEQRARAIENVLLPEVRENLKQIGDQLELIEQEEVVRVHLAADRRS